MFEDDTLMPFVPFDLTYEQYADQHMMMRDIISREIAKIPLCNELYAAVYYRCILKDKKLFSLKDKYYKPAGMALIASPIRGEFLGVYHQSDDEQDYHLSPSDTIELVSALDSFVANNLNSNKIYKCSSFNFNMTVKYDENVLCVDLGHDFNRSYLNKFRCRSMSNKLKDILRRMECRY